MSKQPIAKISWAVFWLGLLAVTLTAMPCRGADKAAAEAAITLDVTNEPLRSVLAKITKKTGWKIKVPDRLLDKPVTQTLNGVALAEGLRAVLNNAGADNLFLLYDEHMKVVTLFDTESALRQAAGRAPAQVNPQLPVVSVTGEPDPILQRAAERASGAAPARVRVNRRARRQSSDDD